jgi:hypothetical protein
MNRGAVLALAILAVLGGLGLGMFAALAAGPSASGPVGSGLIAGLGSTPPSSGPLASASPTAPPGPSIAPSASTSAPPSIAPSPTPTPKPSLVPAPLTGRLVTPAAAALHPIAVMIDDQFDARPQSGFSAASVVWQAPAEGGIPRYMLVFQETIPRDVGPVRSGRYYYIAWAAELRALYVHAGGSPQALATLRAQGSGQLVYNADEFRWGNSFHRVGRPKFAPHNLYTTGAKLRAIAKTVGAKDGPIKGPWTFARDAAMGWRPVGGKIVVNYQANVVSYSYDRKSNTYLRSVTGEKRQIDETTKRRVAPKNVIVMKVRFGPLNDGNPKKHRLEADIVGSGPAWISTNGITIKGTWKKTSTKSPTRFFDAKGKPVVLTVGQTFIQVMKTTDAIRFTPGKPAPPDPRPVGNVLL